MTVRDLIQALATYPQESEVLVDGEAFGCITYHPKENATNIHPESYDVQLAEDNFTTRQ